MDDIKAFIHVRDLGRIEYDSALSAQHHLFDAKLAAKSNGQWPADLPRHHLLLCEHDPVYTLGKRARAENLLTDPKDLKADVVQTDRGGDITFHGPGQLTAYPIIDLDVMRIGLKDYVHLLEESVILTLDDWGLKAGREKDAPGVWIDAGSKRARKICAIGVRSSRHITMHGIGFNINTDLAYFSHMIPCGIQDKQVSSMAHELGEELRYGSVVRSWMIQFADLVSCDITISAG